MIKRNDHIGIPVRDMEPMIAFYTDVMGLTVNLRFQFKGGELVLLGTTENEVQIELIYREQFDENERPHLCFEVEDIVATAEAMKAKGAIFTVDPREVNNGNNRNAWVVDPEGTRIELLEPSMLTVKHALDGEEMQ
ncbi:MAG: VOC family protein [Chloroflexota bacterium]